MSGEAKPTFINRLRFTPMRDVLRGRLTASLDWRTHGFFYLILRASEGISGAHWGAMHNNPSRAMEQLNFAIGYLIDYCRWRDWPVEEAAYQAITSRANN